MSNTAIKKLYLPFWYVSCTFTLAKGLIDFYSLPPYALLSYVVLSTDTQRAPQKRRSEQLAPGSGPLPFYSLWQCARRRSTLVLPLPFPCRSRRALYEWRQQDENWKRDHRKKGADGSTEDFYGVHCFFFRCRLLERIDVIKHGLAKLFCQLALTRTLRIASLEFWQKVNFLDFLQKNIGLWRLKLFFVSSFF